jgi:hypothetical protein
VSNTNLFGTFLDAFAASSAARKGESAGVPATSPNLAGQSPAETFGLFLQSVNKLAHPQPIDPVDAVMKQLLKGPQDIKELMPLVGNSVGQLLSILDKTATAGWVTYDADKHVLLTEAGKQIADLIA